MRLGCNHDVFYFFSIEVLYICCFVSHQIHLLLFPALFPVRMHSSTQARSLAERALGLERSSSALHLHGLSCVATALESRGAQDRGTWFLRGIDSLHE